MKKTANNLFAVLGLLSLVLIGVSFLLLLAPGIVGSSSGSEIWAGYDFVFGNDAMRADANTAMIAAFVLLVLAALFQALAQPFSWGAGAHKFAAFLNVVSGLLLVAPAIIFFMGLNIVLGSGFIADPTLTLGWGYVATGAVVAVAALASLGAGFKNLLAKSK